MIYILHHLVILKPGGKLFFLEDVEYDANKLVIGAIVPSFDIISSTHPFVSFITFSILLSIKNRKKTM